MTETQTHDLAPRSELLRDLRKADKHIAEQAARIAELEAALIAFSHNNIRPGDWVRTRDLSDDTFEWYCSHCQVNAAEWQDIVHEESCPVVVASGVQEKGL